MEKIFEFERPGFIRGNEELNISKSRSVGKRMIVVEIGIKMVNTGYRGLFINMEDIAMNCTRM